MSEERALALSNQRGGVPAVNIKSLDDVAQVADIILAAGWGGQARKIEEVMAKILKGAELGLGAFESQNSIALISGKPCVFGDAMLAVCMASGLLEDIKEELVKTEDGTIEAICTVKRKNLKSATIRKFSTKDAKLAGLLDKPGPWRQNPKRMLGMRARAFALRDAFPDVLCGIHGVEEMDGAEMLDGETAPTPELAPPAPRRNQRKAAAPKPVDLEEVGPGPLPEDVDPLPENEAPWDDENAVPPADDGAPDPTSEPVNDEDMVI